MAIVTPVLTTGTSDSWVEAPLAKGRLLLMNYLLTDRWQSHSYATTVKSVVDILLEFPDDDYAMLEAVEKSLSSLFGLHFDKVQVSVELADGESKTLLVGITWYMNDQLYTITQAGINTADALSRVVAEHNYGDPLCQLPPH